MLPASAVPVPVLVTDRPYKDLRAVGNAFLSCTTAEQGSKSFKRDKRALKDVLSRMVEIRDAAAELPPRKRPPCVLLYTMDGDMYDTVFFE